MHFARNPLPTSTASYQSAADAPMMPAAALEVEQIIKRLAGTRAGEEAIPAIVDRLVTDFALSPQVRTARCTW